MRHIKPATCVVASTQHALMLSHCTYSTTTTTTTILLRPTSCITLLKAEVYTNLHQCQASRRCRCFQRPPTLDNLSVPNYEPLNPRPPTQNSPLEIKSIPYYIYTAVLTTAPPPARSGVTAGPASGVKKRPSDRAPLHNFQPNLHFFPSCLPRSRPHEGAAAALEKFCGHKD